MTATTAQCVCCGRPVPGTEYACGGCAHKAAGHLADIAELTPDARLVAAGLVRRGGLGGSGKPGSRPPLNDGATDALDEIHDTLARTCLRIAVTRGVKFHVSCLKSCVKPSPSQAHCSVCHLTFGGISGFDRHRRDGQCLTPDTIGYTDNGSGVYRAPMTEAGRARLAKLSAAQTAENGSGVPVGGVDATEPAETIPAGSA